MVFTTNVCLFVGVQLILLVNIKRAHKPRYADLKAGPAAAGTADAGPAGAARNDEAAGASGENAGQAAPEDGPEKDDSL